MKLKGLSLFSSAGIGETYISEFVDMKIANEILPKRAKLYNWFYPETHMIQGDITHENIFQEIILKSQQENIDFIYATPPCQSFSKAGKQESRDHRDILFLYILDAIEILQPKYVIIENVPEFIKAKSIHYNNTQTSVIDIIKQKTSDNYNLVYDVVCASNYGTAQKRKRAIILLSRLDCNIWKIPKKLDYIITVRDMIGDLPTLESQQKSSIHKHHSAKKHNDRHILWMSHTPTGKTAFDNEIYFPQKDGRKIRGFKTTYKRINWDEPAPTITMANGSISSQNNVHPGRLKQDMTYSDARVLTVYELILLTGLESDWNIPDNISDTLIRQVIGECVPPLLIKSIMKNLKNNNNK